MAAEVAAQPVRSLKDRLALGKIAAGAGAANVADRRDADDEMWTEDRKFRSEFSRRSTALKTHIRFCSDNRGDNLSKRMKNRTGGGEKGTSELCPRRRGKFKVPRVVCRNIPFHARRNWLHPAASHIRISMGKAINIKTIRGTGPRSVFRL
jgi:hypothetical protein